MRRGYHSLAISLVSVQLPPLIGGKPDIIYKIFIFSFRFFKNLVELLDTYHYLTPVVSLVTAVIGGKETLLMTNKSWTVSVGENFLKLLCGKWTNTIPYVPPSGAFKMNMVCGLIPKLCKH